MARPWNPRLPLHPELWDKPQVRQIAARCGLDRWGVVSRIVRFWVEAQLKATDEGVLEFKTTDWLDVLVECPGFAGAMVAVGWLRSESRGLIVHEFDKFIGKGAIRRLDKADHMAAVRTDPVVATPPLRTQCGPNEDTMGTIATATTVPVAAPPVKGGRSRARAVTTPEFDRFWAAYPRKCNKPDAMKAWATLTVDETLLARMLAAIQRQALTEQWVKDNGQFIPYPATWLNGRRWEDESGPGGGVRPGGRVEPPAGGYRARRDLSKDQEGPGAGGATGGGASLFEP